MMRRRHQDDVRAKISCGQILKRLQNHVDGEIELSTTQVQAARILLDKAIGNAPTETIISGDPENPLQVQHTVDLGEAVVKLLDRIRGESQ